jgi:hypothetical protein
MTPSKLLFLGMEVPVEARSRPARPACHVTMSTGQQVQELPTAMYVAGDRRSRQNVPRRVVGLYSDSSC